MGGKIVGVVVLSIVLCSYTVVSLERTNPLVGLLFGDRRVDACKQVFFSCMV
ncbi:hypothetical protein FHU41_002549 [Psychromicrobium silvestre]|uniref:Uncharacterized protein n=1 Tax=Psychromicrobium silvestre TaxID=1645614 RepID=A0A7Y9LQP4_9MICC|nr:hypothetical protein [Psychromicrobium silvestre]NYE96299.1 hypothetical protein [Psychromicrobium silvestre]